jgi:hypothetical protein
MSILLFSVFKLIKYRGEATAHLCGFYTLKCYKLLKLSLLCGLYAGGCVQMSLLRIAFATASELECT